MLKKGFDSSFNLLKGVYFARDLVWKPANVLNPRTFAEECKKLKKYGVKIRVFNESNLHISISSGS